MASFTVHSRRSVLWSCESACSLAVRKNRATSRSTDRPVSMSRPIPDNAEFGSPCFSFPIRYAISLLIACSDNTAFLFSPFGLDQIAAGVANKLMLIGWTVIPQRGDEFFVTKFLLNE